MTDAQVADEKFLVLINDLLASGEINGLFTDDETTEILTSVKNEVRAQGIEDTRENCWKFFIDKVRRNLKVSLVVRRDVHREESFLLKDRSMLLTGGLYPTRSSTSISCVGQLHKYRLVGLRSKVNEELE